MKLTTSTTIIEQAHPEVSCSVQRAAGTAGIQSVLIRGPGGSWQPMRNTFGAAWEINNAPSMPADLFVTSDDGQQVLLLG